MNIGDKVALYTDGKIFPQFINDADDYTVSVGNLKFDRHNSAHIADGRIQATIAPWTETHEKRYALQIAGIYRGKITR